jgi:hypothetical protein
LEPPFSKTKRQTSKTKPTVRLVIG